MIYYKFAIDQTKSGKFMVDMFWGKRPVINGVKLPFGMVGNKAARLGYFTTREDAQQAVEAKKAELGMRVAA